jgi:hypothetical protein
MSQDIGTHNRSSRPAAAPGLPDMSPGRAIADRATDDLAAGLRRHKATFARVLAHQEDDFARFRNERIEHTRRTLAALERCTSWSELIAVQEDWARVESEACVIEARQLTLHAGLIHHPDWLTRLVRAGGRWSV